jgi:5'-nucleotidase
MQEDKRPLILVTNDDGITAPGIRNLVEAVKDLGRVVVVAPDSPQSGMGHAITIGEPLRLHSVNVFDGIEAYQCSGTPVICVSGINHGANSSINVLYSGTMSAAMEAAIEGIPSVGFSLLDFSFHADFEVSRKVAHDIVRKMLADKMPPHFLLNVNIPKLDIKDFKGMKICRQAHAKWTEDFEQRTDPRGKDYYWMVGRFVNLDKGTETDIEALEAGYASVVPVKFDLTDLQMKQQLNDRWQDMLAAG